MIAHDYDVNFTKLIKKNVYSGDNWGIDSELEPSSGFEPETPSLPWKCSTPELRRPMTDLF